MMNRVSRLVLIALLFTASVAVAGEGPGLPAPAPRIWAPTGDLVGTASHATVTFDVMDAYGDDAKRAEDWQLADETSGTALFNWRTARADGGLYALRGYGTTAGGEGLAGRLTATGSIPVGLRYAVDLRRANHFFDTDSEMRNALFGNPPAPPELAVMPTLGVNSGRIDVSWRSSTTFAARLGVSQLVRDGSRGSLLRAATGDAVPGVKGYDSVKNRELRAGITWAARAVTIDLDGALRSQDGGRSLGTDRTWQDDRTGYQGTLGVQWLAAAGTRVHGAGTLARLENTGTGSLGGQTVTPTGETKTSAGQIGLIQRLGRSMTLRAAARFEKADTDADAVTGSDPQQAVSRQRTRQDYRLALTHTGFEATRLELRYRLRASNRDEVTVDGGTFEADEDRTESELVFRGRHRFSRRALLKLNVGWSSLDREEARNWADPAAAYWMEDYERDQLDWRVALQLRPASRLRLDLGHRYDDRTFTSAVTDGVETGRRRSEGFANLNWTANAWLTVYGTVSVGTEKLETGAAVAPDAGMGALNVDASTLRFVPGAAAQVTARLHCEAMYEGLRYEDEGDVGGALGRLKSDHDRVLLRAGYRLGERFTVTATYRRAEFFEQRWDNAIHDLYGLSLSGRF